MKLNAENSLFRRQGGFVPVIGRFRRAAQQPERKPMLIALPNHLRPRREKIFGPAPAHRLEPDDRVCMTLRWREMDSNFRFRREALSRFDLLRFIYVQKDQSDGGARKAKGQARPARYAGQSGPRAGRLEPGTRAHQAPRPAWTL